MKSRPLIFLVDFLILAILFSPIFVGRYQYSTASPPRDVKTLSDFRAKMDHGEFDYFKFGRVDRDFYEARRLLPFWFTFRSGWSCYVFDSEGKLLDWTADNSGDRDFEVQMGQSERLAVAFDAIHLE